MLTILYIIFSYDIIFYITHRFLHYKNVYKHHKKHHSIKYDKLSFLNAYTGDLLENIVPNISVFIPYIWCSFTIGYFLVGIIVINIRAMLRHDKRFIWLVGNHHLLHHKYPQYNYGEYWLDYILGTNYTKQKNK